MYLTLHGKFKDDYYASAAELLTFDIINNVLYASFDGMIAIHWILFGWYLMIYIT